MNKPNGVTKSTIKDASEENSCHYCGNHLYVGDRAYYHQQEFIVTCSLDCMISALRYRDDCEARHAPENLHYCC